MKYRRLSAGAMAAFAFVSVLTACSSSTKSAGTSPSSAAGSSPSSATGASPSSATGATGSQLSGSPVEVEAIIVTTGTQPQLDVQSGLLAGENAVNADGGVKGRPFKVIICNSRNSQSDPTIA